MRLQHHPGHGSRDPQLKILPQGTHAVILKPGCHLIAVPQRCARTGECINDIGRAQPKLRPRQPMGPPMRPQAPGQVCQQQKRQQTRQQLHVGGVQGKRQRRGTLPCPRPVSPQRFPQRQQRRQCRQQRPHEHQRGTHPACAAHILPRIAQRQPANGPAARRAVFQPRKAHDARGAQRDAQRVRQAPHYCGQRLHDAHHRLDQRPGRPSIVMPQRKIRQRVLVQHGGIHRIVTGAQRKLQVQCQQYRIQRHIRNDSAAHSAAHRPPKHVHPVTSAVLPVEAKKSKPPTR